MRPITDVKRIDTVILSILVLCLVSLPAYAQYGGPRTTNTYNGHFLAPAPSVTSVGGIGASHLPPPLPSVTSLPNYNFHYGYAPYFNGSYYQNRYTHYNGGRGYYGGWSYVVPYYYPADTSAYGYDYVGAGPDLYSGPPPGPNDPVMHMIVEQPPVEAYSAPPEPQGSYQPPAAPPALAPAPEVKPGEPTVLVFRNGKQQEVTNYAIMGDTLYVFDKGKTKIGLADLDIPATVKANDDRGMEFRMPPTPKKKAATPAPQSAKPDQSSDGTPPNIAALVQ